MPLISFVIPCHNVAPWLNRMVDSILGQQGLSLEIILVDDGSTDETGRICDDYAAKDPRIHVLHRNYLDISLTRNAGMEIAQGEYLTFVDGDDVVSPRMGEALAPVFAQCRPDIVRYGFQTQYSDGSTQDWVLPYPRGLCSPEELTRHRLDGIYPEKVLDYSVPRVLSASAHLIRRELVEENHLRFALCRDVLNEDYLFILRALFAAESLYHLPEPLYFYIARSGSLSRHLQDRMMERKRKLIQEYVNFLPMEDGEVQARVRNFYIDSVYDCFQNACNQSSCRKEAMERIRPLLRDSQLSECIRKNRSRIGSMKTRCICLLMSRRMGLSMYFLYRLMAGRKN